MEIIRKITINFMKPTIKIFLLFVIVISCNSRESKNESQTFQRISNENSWGFINGKGDTIIPLGKYRFLNPIDAEGMIYAQLGNKFGYIDINQNTLVPFEYSELSVFSQGLAPAKKNGKFGFINRKGAVVIPFQFENESHFYNSGLAIAKKNNKFGFIAKSGKEIIPIIYAEVDQTTLDSLVIVSKKGKWAFFSAKGRQLTNFEYDEIGATDKRLNNNEETTFSKNGLIWVRKNKQIAYLNVNLKEVIPFGIYNSGERFNEKRLAIVSKKNQFGIINESGKEIIIPQYDTIEHPARYSDESNAFAARKGNSYTLFDESGRKIAANITEYVWDLSRSGKSFKNFFLIKKSTNHIGTIDEYGKIIIPAIYEDILPFDGNDVTIAKINGKFGLLNCTNKIIYPFENNRIETGRFFKFFIVKKNKTVGIIDKQAKIILPFSFEDIYPCFYDQENRFIAKQKGNYGIIDIKGKSIVPFEYSEISNWVEYGPEAHFVTKNHKKGLLSREGKILIPSVYDELHYYDDQIIILSRMGKFGVVNINNKVIIPLEYEIIYSDYSIFEKETNNQFYVRKNGKYFIIDNNNTIIKNITELEIKNKFGYEFQTK